MIPQFSESCKGCQNADFRKIRIQLHLNTISKNANGAGAFLGNFLCGGETGKRFVKIHLCCIVRNLKNDKRNVDVAPPAPGNISADAHAYKCNSV